jgi:hypothetical protein
MYLENARHEAFSGFSESAKRIELRNCIFCPFREGEVCMAYQQALEDYSKKPAWCRYIAVVVGKEDE